MSHLLNLSTCLSSTLGQMDIVSKINNRIVKLSHHGMVNFTLSRLVRYHKAGMNNVMLLFDLLYMSLDRATSTSTKM